MLFPIAKTFNFDKKTGRLLMRYLMTILVACMVLSGCATTKQTQFVKPEKKGIELRANNLENIAKLSIGMTKEDVLNVMGTETIRDDYRKRIYPNPWKTETVLDENKNIHLVIFYYTDVKNSDGQITDDELTPLVFHEDILKGWGWSYLSSLIGDNISKFNFGDK